MRLRRGGSAGGGAGSIEDGRGSTDAGGGVPRFGSATSSIYQRTQQCHRISKKIKRGILSTSWTKALELVPLVGGAAPAALP